MLKNGIEKAPSPPSGLLLGKEHHEHTSSPALPAAPATALSPPVPASSASSAHAKTGSKDSSTQTDKSTELFWPNMASLPSRGRLSVTPSNSPVLKHPAARGAAEKLGTRFRAPLHWRRPWSCPPERGPFVGWGGSRVTSWLLLCAVFFYDYGFPNAHRLCVLLGELNVCRCS